MRDDVVSGDVVGGDVVRWKGICMWINGIAFGLKELSLFVISDLTARRQAETELQSTSTKDCSS